MPRQKLSTDQCSQGLRSRGCKQERAPTHLSPAWPVCTEENYQQCSGSKQSLQGLREMSLIHSLLQSSTHSNKKTRARMHTCQESSGVSTSTPPQSTHKKVNRENTSGPTAELELGVGIIINFECASKSNVMFSPKSAAMVV